MATHSVKLSILDQRLIVYIDHNVHSGLGEKKGGKERDTEAMASGGSLMVRGRGVGRMHVLLYVYVNGAYAGSGRL